MTNTRSFLQAHIDTLRSQENESNAQCERWLNAVKSIDFNPVQYPRERNMLINLLESAINEYFNQIDQCREELIATIEGLIVVLDSVERGNHATS